MQCTYRQAALSSAPHCPAWRSTRPAAQVEIAGHAVNNARARSRVLAASCTVTEAPAPAIADGSLPLHTVSLPVHTHTFKLVKPADVDAVIDWYIAQGQEQADPYWAVPWASGAALASAILQDPSIVRGKRVADVGCGLGLGGLACALAGASEVVLLDREPFALQCALLTFAATGCAAPRADTLARTPAEAEQLAQAHEWVRAQCSDADAAAGGPGSTCSVSAQPFDWHDPPSQQGFDVIVSCDVLYEDDAAAALAQVLPQLLRSSSRGQRMLLADPPNRAPKNRRRFLELLTEGRPDLIVTSSATVQQHFERSDASVQLLHLKVREGGETLHVPIEAIT